MASLTPLAGHFWSCPGLCRGHLLSEVAGQVCAMQAVPGGSLKSPPRVTEELFPEVEVFVDPDWAGDRLQTPQEGEKSDSSACHSPLTPGLCAPATHSPHTAHERLIRDPAVQPPAGLEHLTAQVPCPSLGAKSTEGNKAHREKRRERCRCRSLSHSGDSCSPVCTWPSAGAIEGQCTGLW